jgi:hypothetical protein
LYLKKDIKTSFTIIFDSDLFRDDLVLNEFARSKLPQKTGCIFFSDGMNQNLPAIENVFPNILVFPCDVEKMLSFLKRIQMKNEEELKSYRNI